MSKIIQSGNSLVVTIPASFIKKTGAKLGDEVEIKQNPEKGTLMVTLKYIRQLSFIK